MKIIISNTEFRRLQRTLESVDSGICNEFLNGLKQTNAISYKLHPTTKEVEVIVEEEYIMEEDLIEDWIAEEGQNLKSLLSEWSDRAGWRLVWDTNRNYTLTAGAMFRGTFADVASALIRAFARARPAPIATFYKGNRVLVVETMEDENAYN